MMTLEPPNSESSPSFISPALPPEFMAENPPADRPIRLGIMASGSGSNFEAIAAAIFSGQLHAKIQVMIYNNPQAKVLERANRWQVPAVLHNHRDYPSREDLDTKIIKTLHEHDVELVVMAGWMRIVTPVLIDAFPSRILNLHPSLLPSFKGGHAVEDAIAAGVKISGCTVHWVAPEVDSGKILMQAAVPVFPNDTRESLHARIQVQEHQIYPLAIAIAAAGIHRRSAR
jgi:phosphoribosylglycinamide formyltransferase 1